MGPHTLSHAAAPAPEGFFSMEEDSGGGSRKICPETYTLLNTPSHFPEAAFSRVHKSPKLII